jgi:hypothetical protein
MPPMALVSYCPHPGSPSWDHIGGGHAVKQGFDGCGFIIRGKNVSLIPILIENFTVNRPNT